MNLAISKVYLTDSLSVWRRNLRVYLRLWKTELVAPIVEPIFTFLGFGFGVGALVMSQVEGMSFLSFIGAGVLAFTVLMRPLFEMTYGAYFRMVYQSTYDAILATPVNAESLAFGEILYGVTKATFDFVIILIIATIFGAATSVFAPLSFIPLILGSCFFAAFSLNLTGRIFEIDHFNIFFSIFFSTLFLCGAWFPLEVLPFWLQVIAHILPTTATIDLTRACFIGRFQWFHLAELFYLVIVSLIFVELALRSIRQRMVV